MLAKIRGITETVLRSFSSLVSAGTIDQYGISMIVYVNPQRK